MADFLKPDVLAAWLQAGAAIIALAISVWAVRRSTAAEKRRDRIEAIGIAVAIYPELIGLIGIAARARMNLDQLKETQGTQVGQFVAANTQLYGSVSIPAMIDRNIDRLFKLDEPAGPDCIELVHLLNDYAAFMSTTTARMMSMNAQQWPLQIPHLKFHLDRIERAANTCASEVEAIMIRRKNILVRVSRRMKKAVFGVTPQKSGTDPESDFRPD